MRIFQRLPRALWLSALLLTSSLAAASWAVVPCTLDGTGRLEPLAADAWMWFAADGDQLSCDLPEHEPLDATCSSPDCTPGSRELIPWPGRAVELVGPSGSDLLVEWRAFAAPGQPTELLATRHLKVPGALQVAKDEPRLLRLRRFEGSSEASPETFFLPAPEPEDGPEAIRLEPTWPGPGGELVGFVEADFQPISLRLESLESPRSQSKRSQSTEGLGHIEPDAYGFFARAAIVPGRYRLLAEFQGGIELRGPELEIRGGETSELVPWPLPRHGAVDVELGAELCAGLSADDQLILERRRARKFKLPIDPRCFWRIEGLQPGRWALAIETAVGLASATVEVEAGAVGQAVIDVAATWIEGTVRAAEQPLPGIELRLSRPEDGMRGMNASAATAEPAASAESESAYTDFDGRFRFDRVLDGPAVLELFSENGFAITSRDVDLRIGANVQNFDLGEGRIEVQVSRDDRSDLEGTVTIEVWQAGEGRLVRTGQLEAEPEASALGNPAARDRTVIYDLEYGRYELTAFADGGWVTSERTPVALDKSRSEERVELVLEERRAVATVLDALGSPVPGVLVAIDQRQIEPSGEAPGEYSLVGASAGSELRVLPPPGYIPVCRMLERVESLDVTLQPSTAEAWLIPPAGPPPAAGSFLGVIDGLPGSNCSMPINFLWQLQEDDSGQPLVHVRGLVPGTFRFRNDEGVVILQVPGPPTPMPGVSP